jgi:hypothetical protein
MPQQSKKEKRKNRKRKKYDKKARREAQAAAEYPRENKSCVSKSEVASRRTFLHVVRNTPSCDKIWEWIGQVGLQPVFVLDLP